jgi:simple sugar transport system ATP-binding protein
MPARERRPGVAFRGAALRIEGLCTRPAGPQPGLDGVTFSVRAGEILGVAGVAGNGEERLVDTVLGLVKPASGSIYIDGVDVAGWSVRRRLAAGVVLVPDDPLARSLVGDWSLVRNRLIGRSRDTAFVSGLGVRGRRLRRDTLRILEEYEVAGGPAARAAELSGGNRQRFVVGRELSRPHKVIVASNPTRGLDVRAARAVRERLFSERARGAAVLLLSHDLDEVMEMADRASAIYRGALSAPVTVTPAARESIGRLIVGAPALAMSGDARPGEGDR